MYVHICTKFCVFTGLLFHSSVFAHGGSGRNEIGSPPALKSHKLRS